MSKLAIQTSSAAAVTSIDKLIQALAAGIVPPLADWIASRRLLAAQPWASDEYALAKLRFRNAMHYAQHGLGAAVYELRLLKGCIQPIHVVVPAHRLTFRTSESHAVQGSDD